MKTIKSKSIIKNFFFLLLILFFSQNDAISDTNKSIFNPLYPGIKWEIAKEKAKLINPDELLTVMIHNAMLKTYRMLLPNGIKVKVILDARFMVDVLDSNSKVAFIYTNDRKFNYHGLKIGMPVYKAVKFLNNPKINMIVGGISKSVIGENGIELHFGNFTSFDPKLVWMSDVVTGISQHKFGIDEEKMNWDNFFINKNFSDWLLEEGNKKDSAKLFSPLQIGMKRSFVKRNVKLSKKSKLGYIDTGTSVIFHKATLPNGIKVKVGFCSSRSPNSDFKYLEEDPVLYFIETIDPTFQTNSNLRVGMSIKEAVKNCYSIKWDVIGERTMLFFKDGTCLILEKGKDFFSIDKIPDVPIIAIQERPTFRWSLASFPSSCRSPITDVPRQ